jgi:pyridoxal phosphate enzyme (YggS family)
MSETAQILHRNLMAVQSRMRAACERSGRDPRTVRLVAVTKYAELSWVRTLAEIYSVFGENRPQQLAERSELLPAEWHLIGHLQRNKVNLAVRHASLIHSVDSLRLLEAVSDCAAENHRPAVLLQVNVSREASKTGFAVEELPGIWECILAYEGRVDIRGLMTMAAESADPEEARPVFAELRRLRDRLSEAAATHASGICLNELSMGMSGDFEPAIEEGATLIRIGSLLFEGLSSATV